MITETATLNLATAMETLSQVAHLQQQHIHKHIATGMAVLAKIAKQYGKYGIPNGTSLVFKPIASASNPKNIGRKYSRPLDVPEQYACTLCNKPFVGVPLKDICQCSRREVARRVNYS